MGEMPYRDFPSHIDVGIKWPLVIDLETEDSMLIRKSKRRGKQCASIGVRNGYHIKAMKWREHREFHLHCVILLRDKWLRLSINVFGQFNLERLKYVKAEFQQKMASTLR